MVKYALLGLLRERRDYGYQLKRRFDERLGSLWNLNSGQIYQTLRSLTRAGLVIEVAEEAERLEREVGRQRRVFELTAKGGRALERWLQRPLSRSRPIRDETLLRLLVLAPERHRDAAAQVDKLLHVYRQQMTRILAAKRKLPHPRTSATVLQEIGLEAMLLHTEAHIKWMEFTQRQLTETFSSQPDGETSPR